MNAHQDFTVWGQSQRDDHVSNALLIAVAVTMRRHAHGAQNPHTLWKADASVHALLASSQLVQRTQENLARLVELLAESVPMQQRAMNVETQLSSSRASAWQLARTATMVQDPLTANGERRGKSARHVAQIAANAQSMENVEGVQRQGLYPTENVSAHVLLDIIVRALQTLASLAKSVQLTSLLASPLQTPAQHLQQLHQLQQLCQLHQPQQ